MADILSFEKVVPPERVCYFCKKPESQCKSLIGAMDGPTICDKCVEQCNERIKESNVQT